MSVAPSEVSSDSGIEERILNQFIVLLTDFMRVDSCEVVEQDGERVVVYYLSGKRREIPLSTLVKNSHK
jgi:hypothetical protein